MVNLKGSAILSAYLGQDEPVVLMNRQQVCHSCKSAELTAIQWGQKGV